MFRTQFIDPSSEHDQEDAQRHELVGQVMREIDEVIEFVGQEPKTSYNSNKLMDMKQGEMIVIEFHNTDAHITITKM